MKETIDLSDFRERFKRCGRGKQFSYEGLEALFNYLEEVEAENDEEMELDVIGLCCEFVEYDDMKEFQYDHGDLFETRECIEEVTMYIPIGETDRFIIAQF